MSSTGTALLTPTGLMTIPLHERAHHFELSEGELIIVENAGMRHELRQLLHGPVLSSC